MKRQTDRLLHRLSLLLGICLLAGAALVLIGWQWSIHASQGMCANYLHRIRSLIPAPQGALLEERGDNTMPALSIDGTDFVGILEMPLHDSALPVSGSWGSSGKYPCRFSGSIYDRTMKIGGTSQKGQYDFYRELSVGDPVFFTDMEGNRFSYTITDIRYEKHADPEALNRVPGALTLFIQNIYAFEYIVVFCDA